MAGFDDYSQLETLKLYPPILAIPKYTESRSQELKISTKKIQIGSDIIVVPSLLAIHTHPKYWIDPLEWRPRRWIQRSESDKPSSATLAPSVEVETLMVPQEGTYLPWSYGLQNCPGKRFCSSRSCGSPGMLVVQT
jgi:cytochrome P450